jgi:hypothetical protein
MPSSCSKVSVTNSSLTIAAFNASWTLLGVLAGLPLIVTVTVLL